MLGSQFGTHVCTTHMLNMCSGYRASLPLLVLFDGRHEVSIECLTEAPLVLLGRDDRCPLHP